MLEFTRKLFIRATILIKPFVCTKSPYLIHLKKNINAFNSNLTYLQNNLYLSLTDMTSQKTKKKIIATNYKILDFKNPERHCTRETKDKETKKIAK